VLPVSLYTFGWCLSGLGSGLPFEVFPEFEQFCIAGFVRSRFGSREAAKSRRDTPSVSPGLSSRFLTGLRAPAARQKTLPLLHFPLYCLRRSRLEETGELEAADAQRGGTILH
jgi:hypothetical protein